MPSQLSTTLKQELVNVLPVLIQNKLLIQLIKYLMVLLLVKNSKSSRKSHSVMIYLNFLEQKQLKIVPKKPKLIQASAKMTTLFLRELGNYAFAHPVPLSSHLITVVPFISSYQNLVPVDLLLLHHLNRLLNWIVATGFVKLTQNAHHFNLILETH